MVVIINEEVVIIEKIDIGGILLICVVVKNYCDVVVVFSCGEYVLFLEMLKEMGGELQLEQCWELVCWVFKVFFNYDIVIFNYFNEGIMDIVFKYSIYCLDIFCYGENLY